MKTRSGLLVRASISFPPDVYEVLENLAKQKKVSLAWVVREAAERYIAAENPVSGPIKDCGARQITPRSTLDETE